VVAVDLLEMAPMDGVELIQGDIEDEKVQELVSEKLDYELADIVVSDAVPDFVGEKFIDHMKACYLNKRVFDFCSNILKPGGTLIMKII